MGSEWFPVPFVILILWETTSGVFGTAGGDPPPRGLVTVPYKKGQGHSCLTFPLDPIGIGRYVFEMQDLVKVAKAFADPTRVRIISALRGRELCVCELCEGLKIGQSTLSTHLAVIRDAGLVRARKEGKWVYYELEAEKQPLLRAVFEFFSSSLKRDARVARDARALKTAGNEGAARATCGSGQLPSKRQRGCA